MASNTTVLSGGYFETSSGGAADSTAIGDGGVGSVSYFGTATNTTINSGGYFRVYDAPVTNTTVRGTFVVEDYSGRANNTTVEDYGQFLVRFGGWAISTTVAGLNGKLIVSEDGLADSNTVGEYGECIVSSGGRVTNTTVGESAGFNVYESGSAENTTVSSGGSFCVYGGGVASNTTVNGMLIVSNGGVARNVAVDGILTIESGGKITGSISFTEGVTLTCEEGAIFDFDLTQTSPGYSAIMNDMIWMIRPQDVIFTLTVDENVASGSYNLANNAGNFDNDSTITVVNTDGETLGTISISGGTQKLAGREYTLALTSELLSVTVGDFNDTTPPVITITPSTTELAESVTVTAEFTDDVGVATRQYRIGDGAWTDYTAPVIVTENKTVYFQAADTSGNSVTESYIVTNILAEEKNEPDNGWNDYLYEKKKGWNTVENIDKFAANVITGNGEIYLDLPGSIGLDGKHNMFGNDGTNLDTGDVGSISVTTAAKVSFSIDSTADGTFYI